MKVLHITTSSDAAAKAGMQTPGAADNRTWGSLYCGSLHLFGLDRFDSWPSLSHSASCLGLLISMYVQVGRLEGLESEVDQLQHVLQSVAAELESGHQTAQVWEQNTLTLWQGSLTLSIRSPAGVH